MVVRSVLRRRRAAEPSQVPSLPQQHCHRAEPPATRLVCHRLLAEAPVAAVHRPMAGRLLADHVAQASATHYDRQRPAVAVAQPLAPAPV